MTSPTEPSSDLHATTRTEAHAAEPGHPDDLLDAVGAAYDARASTYDESRMHRDLAAEVAGFCAPLTGPDVLDVATGTGLVLRALRSAATTPLRMTGVDLSALMLAAARRELPDAVLLRADAAALPLWPGSVDLITCVTALHLMPDTRAVLAEWVRVLRPGGRAVTATFTGFAGPARTPCPFPVHHDRFADADLLADQASAVGLRLRRHRPWRHADGDTFLIAELVTADL